MRPVSCRNTYAAYLLMFMAMLTGKTSAGRDTLPELASEVADTDYRNWPFEKKQSYLNSLEEYRHEQVVARMISKREINKNFSSMLASLEPEVRMLTSN